MKSVMKKVFFILNIEILLFISFYLLAFASYPNPTDGPGSFNVNAKNVILYCLIPLLLGIGSLMLEMFLIIKKKEFIITSIISLSINEAIMIAYTTFLFTIITVEWFGNYVNIFSCLIYIASIIILILFKKNKIFKIKENNQN